MRYTTYLHYSSFYQKHRLPFHIVTPLVTIIHYNPFEYDSEAILQLNSLVTIQPRTQPLRSIHDVIDLAQVVNQILSV